MEFGSPLHEKKVVEFLGIKNAYLVDSPIVVHYALKGGYVASTRDWVGIFKVGWEKQREYVTYKYVSKEDIANSVRHFVEFSKTDLPNDDGCSYQFCYISSTSGVIGTTNSFEFKNDLVEDLVELEASGENFVKSKQSGSVFEGLLTKAKFLMLEYQVKMSNEKLATLLEKLRQMQMEIESLINDRQSLVTKWESMGNQVQDMIPKRLSLEQKNEELNKSLEACQVCRLSKTEELSKIDNIIVEEQKKHAKTMSDLENEKLKHNQLVKELEVLGTEISELVNINAGLNDEVGKEQRLVETLSGDLKQAEARLDGLKTTLENESTNYITLCSAFVNAEAMVNESIKSLGEAQSKASELKKNYLKEVKDHDKSYSRLAKVSQKITSLVTELQHVQSTTFSAKNILTSYHKRCEKRSSEFKEKTQENQNLYEQIWETRTKIDDIECQINYCKEDRDWWNKNHVTKKQDLEEKLVISECDLDIEMSLHEKEMSKLNEELSSALTILEETNKLADILNNIDKVCADAVMIQ